MIFYWIDFNGTNGFFKWADLFFYGGHFLFKCSSVLFKSTVLNLLVFKINSEYFLDHCLLLLNNLLYLLLANRARASSSFNSSQPGRDRWPCSCPFREL